MGNESSIKERKGWWWRWSEQDSEGTHWAFIQDLDSDLLLSQMGIAIDFAFVWGLYMVCLGLHLVQCLGQRLVIHGL